MVLPLLLTAIFLAVFNGANDNFKGFATVWGSDTLDYREALWLATFATVVGSLLSWVLADGLVQQFSGKGLVAASAIQSPPFIVSVAMGAALTVFLASRLGFPISTTHALIGGLVGAGAAQAGGVHVARLADAFLLPLLVSPLLAAALGVLAYRLLKARPIEKDCACVALEPVVAPAIGSAQQVSVMLPVVVIDKESECERAALPVRFSIARHLDRLHIGSAMAICLARGVNDTPKLVALLLMAHGLGNSYVSVGVIALAMALGGVLFARNVARTMSQRVTRLDHTSGLAANLITASLVLFASKLGLPVSTTHVSVGAIAGVGASARTLDWQALRNVLLSWVLTLPLAAGVAWGMSRLL
ncbi:inorganic phosphate transporter [Thermomonas sp. S9]|uniref:inorganic phosphate transporter n=1 Tax=Thermomonas sp. S9 TaxID=2885203 RepID=UPI00216ADDB6|nr:inorganic phosphate transporter [Thermomonas sp. S9]MCR6496517.1 inorganic phosphate transporter [Thermomonas sp. S9]